MNFTVVKIEHQLRNFCRSGVKKAAAKGKAKGPEHPADVQAAIDAVDAAVKQLPEEGEVKYTVLEAQEGGGWNQRGGDPAPLNPGSRVSTMALFASSPIGAGCVAARSTGMKVTAIARVARLAYKWMEDV